MNYKHETEEGIQAFMFFINGHEAFPITGEVKGVPNPSAQKTERWTDRYLPLVNGGFGFPVVPREHLDKAGISVSEGEAALAAFGITIVEDKMIQPEIEFI